MSRESAYADVLGEVVAELGERRKAREAREALAVMRPEVRALAGEVDVVAATQLERIEWRMRALEEGLRERAEGRERFAAVQARLAERGEAVGWGAGQGSRV